MRIDVIAPHGFCLGVERALNLAQTALTENGGRVCCLHPLVHNEAVCAALRAQGMVFVDALAEVPDGAHVLFSAHGVAPAVREEARRRGLSVTDATCPFVALSHRRVAAFLVRRVPVAVVGQASHAEVKGLLGEGDGLPGARIAAVADAAAVAALDFAPDAPVGVVVQTTLDAARAEEVLSTLRARFPFAEGVESAEACRATRDRQQAVSVWTAEAKRASCGGRVGVVVVGSAASSNVNRLVETARRVGADFAARAENAVEAAALDLSGITALGVTSGASTPEEMLNAVVRRLREIDMPQAS